MALPRSWTSGPDHYPQELLKGSWEFDHLVHRCFVDLEKAVGGRAAEVQATGATFVGYLVSV